MQQFNFFFIQIYLSSLVKWKECSGSKICLGSKPQFNLDSGGAGSVLGNQIRQDILYESYLAWNLLCLVQLQMKAFSQQFLVQEGEIIDFIEEFGSLVPLNKAASTRASPLEPNCESSVYSDPIDILKRNACVGHKIALWNYFSFYFCLGSRDFTWIIKFALLGSEHLEPMSYLTAPKHCFLKSSLIGHDGIHL